MAQNGIDIASYQGSLNFSNISADFAVIKATEGTSYVNPYCDTHFQQLKSKAIQRGVYHFAGHTDAIKEADYFVDSVDGYIHDAILALDWEGSFVQDINWALTWLNRVYTRTGVKPLIYMSEWVENHYDWSAIVKADYGLWIAKYSDYEIDNNYDMSNAGAVPSLHNWDFAVMWQWTSVGRLSGYAGNLDCDIFYGTAATWNLYAGTSSLITKEQLDSVFNEILGRNADQSAIDHYVGHYTYDFVKNDVAASSERAQYVAAQAAAVQAAIEAKAKADKDAQDAAAAEALKKAQEDAAKETASNNNLDTENNGLLKKILELLQSLVDKITGIFK